MRSTPIKVLVVDDSPFVRAALMRALSAHDDIAVIGGAKDPYEAREMIIEYRPDVIILDTHMPRLDGITFLKKLMIHYPVPVIMCAEPGTTNGRVALDAIEIGATDVVVKPMAVGKGPLQRLGEEVANKVRAASVALRRPPPIPPSAAQRPISLRSVGLDPSRYLVTIGASTGGTEAIKDLLSRVPADFPPVAIVQHMPEGFTLLFADRLDKCSPLSVREARDGEALVPGVALLGRGGTQMTVRGNSGPRRIAYGSNDLVNRHCPAVDVLFDSAARAVGKQGVGILLTGMGADGAKGLLNMRNAGAVTIGQSQRSCVVYGMPKVANNLGAVQIVGSPSDIPNLTVQALRSRDAKRE